MRAAAKRDELGRAVIKLNEFTDEERALLGLAMVADCDAKWLGDTWVDGKLDELVLAVIRGEP